MLETDHYVATKEVKKPVVHHMTDKDQRTVAEHEATNAVEEEGEKEASEIRNKTGRRQLKHWDWH